MVLVQDGSCIDNACAPMKLTLGVAFVRSSVDRLWSCTPIRLAPTKHYALDIILLCS